MKPHAKYRICVGSAILIQIVFLCIAIGISWRADHFVVLPGLVPLFPHYFVAVETVGWGNMNLLLFWLTIVFLFQWPIYGWFVGFGWVRSRLWQHASVVIIVHALAALASLSYFER